MGCSPDRPVVIEAGVAMVYRYSHVGVVDSADVIPVNSWW